MPDEKGEEAAKPAAQAVSGKPGRYLVSTGTKYEFQFGYSRAIRHGSVIRLSGTAGLNEDGDVVSDDVSGQLRRALEIMRGSLRELGGDLGDVVMTRIYLADMRDADTAAVVHGEVFRDIRPATTIVKSEFVDRRILVEIEAEAVYGGADDKSSGAAGNPGAAGARGG
ncbi:MAG: RidA family protein [Candidatus Limnocylindria bacterium]